MEKKKSSVKARDILFAAGLIITAVLAVMGHHFSENANKPFWWNFWERAAYACIPLFIGLAWLVSRKKNKNVDE